MKKFINLLSFGSAFITSILIICTFLTTYQFYYVGQIFNSYFPIQLGVCITMAILSLRFLVNDNGSRRLLYSAVSFVIAVCLLFFMNGLVR
ncbi:hypothetical protein [uncultured Clostridium sp.]|uniref:hypothetical protein n=1 Tax=uncultured Clostridium sp. TaxID=59620 RepID=UPI0025FA3610|nr:hypothetical protein [uncultured Clostridium sp.]